MKEWNIMANNSGLSICIGNGVDYNLTLLEEEDHIIQKDNFDN